MFWWLMKKKIWLWAGWVDCYLLRSLSAHGNIYQLPTVTEENSHLRSGPQEVSLVMGWMSQGFTYYQSTWVQVIAWCRQATSHYLSRQATSHYMSQCWPISILPYMGSQGHNELECETLCKCTRCCEMSHISPVTVWSVWFADGLMHIWRKGICNNLAVRTTDIV